MEHQKFIKRIQELNDVVNTLKEVIESLKKQSEANDRRHEENNRRHEEDMAILRKLQELIDDNRASMKELQKELAKYRDRMDRSNDETFNTKSRKKT